MDAQRELHRLDVRHGELLTETEPYELVTSDEADPDDEKIVTAEDLQD